MHAKEHFSYELSERLKPLIEWREYGPAAFEEAVRGRKPIFLLLTAPSWCYWCQVYESEEYLFHPSVASYINENFIPIYVDADRRQDLTGSLTILNRFVVSSSLARWIFLGEAWLLQLLR